MQKTLMNEIISRILTALIFASAAFLLNRLFIIGGKKMLVQAEKQVYPALKFYQKIVGSGMMIGGWLAVIIGILGVIGLLANMGH